MKYAMTRSRSSSTSCGSDGGRVPPGGPGGDDGDDGDGALGADPPDSTPASVTARDPKRSGRRRAGSGHELVGGRRVRERADDLADAGAGSAIAWVSSRLPLATNAKRMGWFTSTSPARPATPFRNPVFARSFPATGEFLEHGGQGSRPARDREAVPDRPELRLDAEVDGGREQAARDPVPPVQPGAVDEDHVRRRQAELDRARRRRP